MIWKNQQLNLKLNIEHNTYTQQNEKRSSSQNINGNNNKH